MSNSKLPPEDRAISAIKLFVNVLAWLRIALSPTLAGAAIGFVVYKTTAPELGVPFGSGFFCLGLVAGCILAGKQHANGSSVEFVARVSASPDFSEATKTPGSGQE